MINEFIDVLKREYPDVEIDVDSPDDPNGESWIDIRTPSFSTSVSYRPAEGFGVYVSDGAYGDGPDEIFLVAQTAATRVAQLC